MSVPQRMSRANGFDQAVKRVMDALDSLDAVLDQRVGKDNKGGSLVEQLHAFAIDRARLALELDAARARARDLESTNREAVRRIDEAMSAIRAIIAASRS